MPVLGPQLNLQTSLRLRYSLASNAEAGLVQVIATRGSLLITPICTVPWRCRRLVRYAFATDDFHKREKEYFDV